jgi:hypothetical protein
MHTSDTRLLDLSKELKALGIPDAYYSIGHPHDERTCLVLSDGKWLVYYSERGSLGGLREFDNYDDAKKELINRLK